MKHEALVYIYKLKLFVKMSALKAFDDSKKRLKDN